MESGGIFDVYLETFAEQLLKSKNADEQMVWLSLIIEGLQNKLDMGVMSAEEEELCRKMHEEYLYHYSRLLNK